MVSSNLLLSEIMIDDSSPYLILLEEKGRVCNLLGTAAPSPSQRQTTLEWQNRAEAVGDWIEYGLQFLHLILVFALSIFY